MQAKQPAAEGAKKREAVMDRGDQVRIGADYVPRVKMNWIVVCTGFLIVIAGHSEITNHQGLADGHCHHKHSIFIVCI